MLTSCALTLTDEEFIQFLIELNEVATKYMTKPVTKTSASRQITLVSSPVDLQRGETYGKGSDRNKGI